MGTGLGLRIGLACFYVQLVVNRWDCPRRKRPAGMPSEGGFYEHCWWRSWHQSAERRDNVRHDGSNGLQTRLAGRRINIFLCSATSLIQSETSARFSNSISDELSKCGRKLCIQQTSFLHCYCTHRTDLINGLSGCCCCCRISSGHVIP